MIFEQIFANPYFLVIVITSIFYCSGPHLSL